jgi:SNF2 family DNA or RNA helicase
VSDLWKPRKYQSKGIKDILKNPNYLLLWDPGLGKTSTVLAAFIKMQKEDPDLTMLIVAPLQVATSVWPREIQDWSNFSHLKVSVVCGTAKSRQAAADAYADVYVTNYENLVWLLEWWEKHQGGWTPDVLVADESTKFKAAYKSKRFVFLKQRLPYFKRRYCLSGTPTPNHLLDIWAQAYVADLGDALSPYITRFRTRYFRQSGYGGHEWKPHPGAEDEIYKKLAPICSRLDKLDHLDLPKLVVHDVPVALPHDVMDDYWRIEKHLIAKIDSEMISAANAAAATQKLRQIANGRVYGGIEPDDSDRVVVRVHDKKRDALADLLEQISDSVLIMYEFDHDIDSIIEALPDDSTHAIIGGKRGVRGAKSLQAQDRWNSGEQNYYMIAHPDAAGHGLNLQKGGRHLVFFGLSWKRDAYDQPIARLWRDNKKDADHTVVVHRLVAQNTVDEDICHVVATKGSTQKRLLDALKRRHKK